MSINQLLTSACYFGRIAAVAQGNEAPRAQIEAFLPQAEEKGWQLTVSVQRIWAGERD